MRRIWRKFMNLFRRSDNGHSHEPKNPVPVPMPTPDEATFSGLNIEIHGMENFSVKEREKFLRAMELGKQVLNSLELKERILACEVGETNGLSNLQIWELICTGKDLYNEHDDRDIDVFITMYENYWTSTVGYTFPNTFKTWVNRKFFRYYDEAEIFGNVFHEALHNFGFDHLVNKSKSVPYVLGYIGRDLVKELMDGKQLTPLAVGV